ASTAGLKSSTLINNADSGHPTPHITTATPATPLGINHLVGLLGLLQKLRVSGGQTHLACYPGLEDILGANATRRT
ncbi:MAG: hypothetical protein ACRDPW_01835, partial [Mycobacteriales bacterium]